MPYSKHYKFYLTAILVLLKVLAAQQELECLLTLAPFQGENDEYIRNIRGGGDLNGDGYDDIVIGRRMHWDSINEVYTPSKINIYYGSAEPDTIPDVIIEEGEYEGKPLRMGNISYNGDLNNDGYDDLVLSGGYDSDTYYGTGLVLIFWGGETISSEPDLILAGQNYAEDPYLLRFGDSIDLSGDVNGDGFNDLIIGSSGTGFYYYGQVDIFYGSSNFDTEVDWHKQGEPADKFGGNGLSVGDLNNDGYSDLVVPLGYYQQNNGRLQVYAGGENMSYEPVWSKDLGDLETIFLDANGDVNGDDFADIVYSLNGNNEFNIATFNTNFENTQNELVNYKISSMLDLDSNGNINFFSFPLWSEGNRNMYIFENYDFNIDNALYMISNSTWYYIRVYSIGNFNRDDNKDVLIGYKIEDKEYFSVYTKEVSNNIKERNISKSSNIISNYPNPFNSSTIINFHLNDNCHNTELLIINQKGEIVKELHKGTLNKGKHSYRWVDINLPSGIYFVKLILGNKQHFQKITYLK
jgi:hypothetical protein